MKQRGFSSLRSLLVMVVLAAVLLMLIVPWARQIAANAAARTEQAAE